MKSTSTLTIAFAIFLTIWIEHLHVAVGELSDFDRFLQELEEQFGTDPTATYTFMVADNVIEKLKNTSDEFKAICVSKNVNETSLSALTSALWDQFRAYVKMFRTSNVSLRKKLKLMRIEAMDPIGFIVYLTEQNARSPSDVALRTVEFYRTMPLQPQFGEYPLQTGSTSSGNTELETGSTSSDNTELETGSTSSGHTELAAGSMSIGDGLECAICLQTLKPEAPDRWVAPDCRHAFHRGCIDRWVDACKGAGTCPCCRLSIQT